MLQLLKRLFSDENGMILSSEVVLVGTILVLGAITGLSSLSYAVNGELTDVANAASAYQQPNQYGSYHSQSQSSGGYYLTSSEGLPEVVGY